MNDFKEKGSIDLGKNENQIDGEIDSETNTIEETESMSDNGEKSVDLHEIQNRIQELGCNMKDCPAFDTQNITELWIYIYQLLQELTELKRIVKQNQEKSQLEISMCCGIKDEATFIKQDLEHQIEFLTCVNEERNTYIVYLEEFNKKYYKALKTYTNSTKMRYNLNILLSPKYIKGIKKLKEKSNQTTSKKDKKLNKSCIAAPSFGRKLFPSNLEISLKNNNSISNSTLHSEQTRDGHSIMHSHANSELYSLSEWQETRNNRCRSFKRINKPVIYTPSGVCSNTKTENNKRFKSRNTFNSEHRRSREELDKQIKTTMSDIKFINSNKKHNPYRKVTPSQSNQPLSVSPKESTLSFKFSFDKYEEEMIDQDMSQFSLNNSMVGAFIPPNNATNSKNKHNSSFYPLHERDSHRNMSNRDSSENANPNLHNQSTHNQQNKADNSKNSHINIKNFLLKKKKKAGPILVRDFPILDSERQDQKMSECSPDTIRTNYSNQNQKQLSSHENIKNERDCENNTCHQSHQDQCNHQNNQFHFVQPNSAFNSFNSRESGPFPNQYQFQNPNEFFYSNQSDSVKERGRSLCDHSQYYHSRGPEFMDMPKGSYMYSYNNTNRSQSCVSCAAPPMHLIELNQTLQNQMKDINQEKNNLLNIINNMVQNQNSSFLKSDQSEQHSQLKSIQESLNTIAEINTNEEQKKKRLQLKKEKAELRKEKENLTKRRCLFNKKAEKFKLKQAYFSKRESEIIQKEKKLQIQEQRITFQKQTLQTEWQKMDKKREELVKNTKIIDKEWQNVFTELTALKSLRTKSLHLRKQLKTQETTLCSKEEEVSLKRTELQAEEAQIKEKSKEIDKMYEAIQEKETSIQEERLNEQRNNQNNIRTKIKLAEQNRRICKERNSILKQKRELEQSRLDISTISDGLKKLVSNVAGKARQNDCMGRSDENNPLLANLAHDFEANSGSSETEKSCSLKFGNRSKDSAYSLESFKIKDSVGKAQWSRILGNRNQSRGSSIGGTASFQNQSLSAIPNISDKLSYQTSTNSQILSPIKDLDQ